MLVSMASFILPNPALVRTVRLRRPAAQLSRYAARGNTVNQALNQRAIAQEMKAAQDQGRQIEPFTSRLSGFALRGNGVSGRVRQPDRERGGATETTVDRADIRALGSTRLLYVVELPRSRN